MKKSYSPIIVLLLLLLVVGAPIVSSAQSLANAWRTFDRYDGFESNWVYTAIQMPDHTLWFGADDGIARFDGAWRMFGEEDGLPKGAVHALMRDKNGDLRATTTGGVAKWSDEGWVVEPIDGAEGEAIYALTQSDDGSLWVGAETGLFVKEIDAETWHQADTPLTPVEKLAVDAMGEMWLASGNQLFRSKDEAWEAIPLTVGDQPLEDTIAALAAAEDGSVWIGTSGSGLVQISGEDMTWYHEEEGLPSADIQAIFPSSNGRVWVGTNGGGVAWLKDGQWQVLNVADGLVSDFVSTILEDSDGVMWFGAIAGISRYDEHTWRKWEAQQGAPQSIVSTLSITPDGRLWAGTDGEGLHIFDGNAWQKHTLEAGFIESSFVDADGNVWLGADQHGLLFIGEGDKASQKSPVLLAGNVIVDMAQTPDGALWFATFQNGLSRWDGEQWQHFYVDDGLISDALRALYVDSQGRLWVGSADGGSVFDNGAWQNFTGESDLESSEITDIVEAADGSMWFATWGDGVARWSNGEWTYYDAGDGLLAPNVETIWADPAGPLLFGTVSGLSVYDGQAWQNFGVANGIEIGRIYAMAPAVGGGTYLGTAKGVVRFLPDHSPPQIQILSINGRPAEQGLIQLTPDESIYIALNGRDLLTDAGDLFYHYRLVGYDNDWQGSRTPLVSYPALPEGHYRFEARVRDDGMNYSEPIVLEIEVSQGPITIALPLIGEVKYEFAFIGVALLTVLAIVLVWAVWSTIARARMGRQAVEHRFNPYIAGNPIRDKHMFYGRQSLLSEIEATLFHNSLLLHGERRIGKTSLLYQLVQRLEIKQDEDYRYIPIYVDLEGTPESEFFHRIMENVLDTLVAPLDGMPGVEKLRYLLPNTQELYGDRDFRRDLRDIVEYLNRYYHQEPRLVLLLDEADILNAYHPLTQQQFRRILQDSFAGNVRAVVTGVHISKTWDRVESPWYNMFVESELKPFKRDEAERLMREPVEGFYTWDDDAVSFIWSVSQGRPHRIQQIALEAVNLMLTDRRRRITKNDATIANAQILANTSFDIHRLI